MAIANTSTNRNYYEVNHYLHISSEIEIGSKEWYQAIKKAGYKFAYRWINSEENWMYFAKTQAQAKEGAAELFAKEQRRDMEFARKYSYEYVDVISIDHIIDEWF